MNPPQPVLETSSPPWNIRPYVCLTGISPGPWSWGAAFTGSAYRRSILWVERVTGVEPAPTAWKAVVLPLNYTRKYPQRRRRGRLWRVAAPVLGGVRFTVGGWGWQQASNPRPADYKSAALPSKLCQRMLRSIPGSQPRGLWGITSGRN